MLRDRLAALWDHPWLVGGPDVPGRKVVRRSRLMAMGAALVANTIGAGVVVCFALFALPKPDDIDVSRAILLNLALAAGYLLLALVVGILWGRRRIEGGRHGIREWIEAERPPTPGEQRRALRAPLRIMLVQATLWAVAVVCFTALNLTISGLLALGVGLTIALGGITTSTAAYLLSELALRPVTARALSAGTPRRRVSGVAMRWLGTWALGTGVPLVGLVLVAIVALTPVDIDLETLAVTAITLAGIGLIAGALVSLLGAYLTAHPVGALRRGLDRVRGGDLEVEIPVWDTTELGLLQIGFNEMVAGLREREQLQDLFGRHVGEEVARHALDDGVELGGETREVVVLFVDITGATRLASERSPQEVVELLNRFFGEVVEVVERHGGWINKFEGDAALAIFGAPVPIDDAAGCALESARELVEQLRGSVPELDFGVGVAAGEAVAGHIGAESRLEYTVIGDPVNEAARLTELAKERDCRALASDAALERASDGEAGRWKLVDSVRLRGRGSDTRVAAPE